MVEYSLSDWLSWTHRDQPCPSSCQSPVVWGLGSPLCMCSDRWRDLLPRPLIFQDVDRWSWRNNAGRQTRVCLLFLVCQEGAALVKWKKWSCAVKGGNEGHKAAAGNYGREMKWRAQEPTCGTKYLFSCLHASPEYILHLIQLLNIQHQNRLYFPGKSCAEWILAYDYAYLA